MDRVTEADALWSVRVIFGMGQAISNRNATVCQASGSSHPENVCRGTFNGLLWEGSKPRTNGVLFVR